MKKQEKVNLLDFQRNLNNQFERIFDKDSSQNNEDFKNEDTNLGLLNKIKDYNFYISLNELKNISSTNKYENINITKSWILGVNHVQNDVYTIINIEKVLDVIKNKKSDFHYEDSSNDSNIVYLKTYEETNLGIVINKLELLNIKSYNPLYSFVVDNDICYWESNSENKLENIKNDLNIEEFNFLSKINNLIELNKKVSIRDVKDEEDLFCYIIKKIILGTDNKLILILNVEMLIKILGDMPPY